MRKLGFTFLSAVLIVCVAGSASALDPGDVGSVECRQAQLDVFDAVADHGSFPNHGQLMKAINQLLNPEIHDGMISGECAACIRSQFARKIPPEEHTACGEDPVDRVIAQYATENFERIRELVDLDDDTPTEVRFVGRHVEVTSEAWTYILDLNGRQVFRPVAAAPHLESAFAAPIGPDVDAWQQQRVPEQTVGWAQELALAIFGAGYVFEPATRVIPVRELITSKAADSEAFSSYEGRTSVLFRPPALDDDLVESIRTTFTRSPEGEPEVVTRSVEVPSRSYETAVTFAPAGHVMRVESGYVTSEGRDFLGMFRNAVAEGFITFEPVLHERDLQFGTFFSPLEPRLELTAYSYEGEDFLTTTLPDCEHAKDCNPFETGDLEWYCYNAPWAPPVNTYIRLTDEYRFDTFNTWHKYGRKGGIRGNWDPDAGAWTIPNVDIRLHANLGDYLLLNPPSGINKIPICQDYPDFAAEYPVDFSIGNKLLPPFYDDLESCHVAMFNTHGGPIWSSRIGRETFQFLRSQDQWATLHEVGDDGLGVGRLRHLLLETCSTMNWRNAFRSDPNTLITDFMTSHIADGVRTIAGFDGCRWGGQVTGWRFFGYYNDNESISQSWIAMGLDENECNMPIVVAYGATEEEAAETLFDGRFSTLRGNTGWAVAVEPITEEHLAPRACCLPIVGADPCTMLSHAECKANGGEPLDCGTTCEKDGDDCE